MAKSTNSILKIPLIPFRLIGRKFIGDQSRVKKELKFCLNSAKNVVGFNHWSVIVLVNGFGYIGVEKIYLTPTTEK